jgi:hypothetical protein
MSCEHERAGRFKEASRDLSVKLYKPWQRVMHDNESQVGTLYSAKRVLDLWFADEDATVVFIPAERPPRCIESGHRNGRTLNLKPVDEC